jgi:hypothetical protein
MIKHQELRLAQEIAALIILIRVYYIKQIHSGIDIDEV